MVFVEEITPALVVMKCLSLEQSLMPVASATETIPALVVIIFPTVVQHSTCVVCAKAITLAWAVTVCAILCCSIKNLTNFLFSGSILQ